MESKETLFKNGGRRPGSGRKSHDGRKRQYIVADDVHAWIKQHGGGAYITTVIRTIIATTPLQDSHTAE